MTRSAAVAAVAIEPAPRAEPVREAGPRAAPSSGPELRAVAAPRVFAIDRRPLVASGLAGLARRGLGGNAHGLTDVEQALAALRLVKTPPRAVLVGVQPGDDSAQLVKAARRLGAPVVCVLSGDDSTFVRAALAAGADGYLLLEGADSEVVRTTIAAVEAGERVVPPALVRFADGDRGDSRTITKRCLEVLHWLAEGLHDDEIAAQLQISTSSVRKHIASAQERLEARTRTQVVAMVARNGLL